MNVAVKVLLSGALVMAGSLAHAQSVTLAPSAPHPEAAVTVTGAHFADGEAIDVYIDTVDTLLLVSTSTGTFSGTVTVPAAAAPGKHYITAIGRRSGDAAQAVLTVTTPWVEDGYGAQHHGWNPYENTVNVDNVAQLDVLWSAPVNGLGGTPTVSSGKAFFGTYAGVVALSTATGAVAWTAEASDAFFGSPAVVGGFVYAVGYSGTVYALTAATGAQIWSVNVGTESYSSPVVVAGVVYVADYNGAVYALQASSGHTLWSTVLGGSIDTSPTVANGTVYIGCEDYNLYALNATTGAVEWKYTTLSFVESTAAVSGGFVYVGSDDGNVYAIRAADGTLLWSYRNGFDNNTPPAVAYGNVYIASNDGMSALDAKFGTLTWSNTESAFANAAVANGVVYVAQGADSYGTNSLYALDPYDGEVLARWAIGTDLFGGPAISDGVVYMNAHGGSATALSLLAGTGAVRAEPRAPEISTLHPDLTLEVTQR